MLSSGASTAQRPRSAVPIWKLDRPRSIITPWAPGRSSVPGDSSSHARAWPAPPRSSRSRPGRAPAGGRCRRGGRWGRKAPWRRARSSRGSRPRGPPGPGARGEQLTEVSSRTGRCRCSAGRSPCGSPSRLPGRALVMCCGSVRVPAGLRLLALPSCPRRPNSPPGSRSGRERRGLTDGCPRGRAQNRPDHLLEVSAKPPLLEVGLQAGAIRLSAVERADDGAPIQYPRRCEMFRDGDAAPF